MPWNEIDSIECIDQAAMHWESLFNKIADKHAPIKKQRVKGFKTPWILNEYVLLPFNNLETASLKARMKSHVSCVMYLDLEKAFDTVDHSLLLLKLTEHGVSAACLQWSGSYLSQRSLQTSVGDALSSKRNVTIGVP